MSYQVLARKWRPKTFAELSGQEHVVTALTNALSRGRLHHAYLLTGTRGIGKTTIARILAKSVNCVNGVTATPCGVCPACVEIDSGRFVDLLELDAASNTGIVHILDAEKIAHDEAGVALVARAAQGSVRDALSLLDQAIAFGGGEVRESVVRTMLGAVDRDHVYRIVEALIAKDGSALLAQSASLSTRGLAFGTALDELASLFHRIAVAQVVAEAGAEFDDAARIDDYAARFTPESVQLAYQICAQGRADLAIAPDEE